MTSPIATLDRCIRMMQYLGLTKFTIPHHNMVLPDEVINSDHYRPDKLIQLDVSGKLIYVGMAYHPSAPPYKYKERVVIDNIPATDIWVKRAYTLLQHDILDKVDGGVKVNYSEIPDVRRVILKFEGLEFVA